VLQQPAVTAAATQTQAAVLQQHVVTVAAMQTQAAVLQRPVVTDAETAAATLAAKSAKMTAATLPG
jgi:hypothetical protein